VPVTTIAFAGMEGALAHAAVRGLPAAEHASLLPLPNVTSTIDAVRTGRADAALVPLENSVEGAVAATLDELANSAALVIREETYLSVSFGLMGRPGTVLANVSSVAAPTHVEAQVRRWLIDTLPTARVALVASTVAAVQAVADGECDAGVGAVFTSMLNGLDILAHDIAGTPPAVTRFVLLSRPMPPPERTGNDLTTLVAFLREDHYGDALLEILIEFGTRGINLTRIESRPTKNRIGDYCFSIDCEGHVDDARVGDAVAALRRVCADVRYLGSYPRQSGLQGPLPPGRSDSDFAESRSWLANIRESGTSQI